MKQIVFLMVSLFFVVSMPLVAAARDVNINIGVPPPPLEFAGPPDVVVVPSGTTYVYMAPDMPGVYFHHNYWYRFHEGRWFRSTIYSGPWVYFETFRVPRVIVNVPPDYYRHLPPGYHRIHYDDLHRNWRSWDKSRHWHKHDWYKREHETWRRDHHKPPLRDGRKPPPPHDGGGQKPPLVKQHQQGPHQQGGQQQREQR